MAQEDWAGSNNGAIYLCPTRIRSSNDTWGILFNRFLQKNKTNHEGAINIRSLVCLSHGLYGTSTLLSTTVQIGRLQAAKKKPKVNALLLQKQNQSSYKFLISAREQFDPSSTKIWYIGLTCIYPSHLNINMHTLPTFSIHFLRCWQGELD